MPGRKPSILLMLQLPPPVHGASVMNRIVAGSRMLADRFDVRVLDIKMNDRADTLRAFSVGKLLRSLALLARLLGQLVRNRPNIVYLTLAPVGFAFYRDLLFIAAIKAFGCRRVYHLHGRGIDEAAGASALKHALYRWAFTGSDAIVLCRSAAADVRRVADPSRVHVVNNGIEDPFPDQRSRELAAGPTRILFLSNMLPEKGPLVLLDALAMLHARGLAFAADFAGGWRPPLDEVRFRHEVESRRLGGRVTVHGPAYGDRKQALMEAASIFVLPTYYRFETFPVSILEAMAAGLAVVSTRHGGIPEIIDHGASGVLVPPRDAAALADALEALLADAERARALGTAARRIFETRFTVAVFEHTLADVLMAITAGGTQRELGAPVEAHSQVKGRR